MENNDGHPTFASMVGYSAGQVNRYPSLGLVVPATEANTMIATGPSSEISAGAVFEAELGQGDKTLLARQITPQ